jgi:hypothetical protein
MWEIYTRPTSASDFSLKNVTIISLAKITKYPFSSFFSVLWVRFNQFLLKNL